MFSGFYKKRRTKYEDEGKKTYSSMEMKAEKSGLSTATKESCTDTVTVSTSIQIEMKDEGNCSKTSNPRVNKEDEELESAKGKMGEAKEENQRLKKMLDKVESDYRSLQLHFFDILQRDPPQKPVDSPENDEFELEKLEISLCLGKRPVESRTGKEDAANERDVNVNDELNLGLDLKGLSESGKCEMEEDDRSPERREVKALRSESKEEGSESNVAKRARVSIRARCETPTMHDGCQWRKYGQKTAKGNPCPRAYYRCTIAPSCPVRKQVQRCPQDMSILTTTYEGTHNHPLPIAATAMASTTSAAASMLMSRSSTSQGLTSLTAPATSTTANINGVNFTLFDNSTTRPYNFPNGSSLAPPTITLDLTTNPSSHLINRFSQPPKFSSTSLDFSSSSENIKFPTPWGNSSNYLNYNPSPPFNKTPIGTLDFSKQPNGLTGSVRNSESSSPSQQLFTETIAKVLTSAPSFQHAVAAAISNMVGSGNNTNSWRATGNGYQNQVTGFPSVNNLPSMAKPSFTSYPSNPTQPTLLSSLSLSKGTSSMAPSTSIDANNNQ